MKKTLKYLALILIILVFLSILRTFFWTTASFPEAMPTESGELGIDPEAVAGRLAEALRFKTISEQDTAAIDYAEFDSLHAFLRRAFPRVHAGLELRQFGKSLLFIWQSENTALKPFAFLAHQDVVPVIPGTERDWPHPPFAGIISEGYIHGRGALDDKASMMAILEAAELLLARGFTPARTLYFIFGQDEEIGGRRGAARIARHLQEQGIEFDMVLDEGGAIAEGILPGVDTPIALVGIAEKGYFTIELKVRAEGGHSSVPPKHTAIGILSRAISRLEGNPFPADLRYSTQMIRGLGDKAPFVQRLLFANQWLFAPLLKKVMSDKPSSNASIRTTTAVTMISGGVKENVLPIEATAVVNFRILPGETRKSVIARVRRIIDDSRVEIRKLGGSDPSPVSRTDSPAFALLQRTIRESMPLPGLAISPYLVMAGTDAKHFSKLSENVYRFIPLHLQQKDMKRIHGTGERIEVENYARIVAFYLRLFQNAGE